jgi:acyl transferase domain-containing protein
VDLWVRGLDLDWSRFYDAAPPQRMSLPTYPFAREKCWVKAAAPRKPTASGRVVPNLHALLHRNTSDLSRQSYRSTFSGDEFFLTDHRVNGQQVLPAVAYLEMVRAALEDAMPAEKRSLDLELRHVIWAQPIVVSEAQDITIAIVCEDGEHVDFEIYSEGGGADEVLHCQGSCVIGGQSAVPKLDLAGLRAQTSRGRLEGSALYPVFATLGLDYGAAFQGLAVIHRGEGQLLAELTLPDAARRNGGNYVLHPSLMDGALQASIALMDDSIRASGSPWLPFALESLRAVSACTDRMLAWVRYSPSARATSNLIKVDIDLCDPDGNVCVQMRGFASRPFQRAAAYDETHYRSVIAGVVSNEISADQALELG